MHVEVPAMLFHNLLSSMATFSTEFQSWVNLNNILQAVFSWKSVTSNFSVPIVCVCNCKLFVVLEFAVLNILKFHGPPVKNLYCTVSVTY